TQAPRPDFGCGSVRKDCDRGATITRSGIINFDLMGGTDIPVSSLTNKNVGATPEMRCVGTLGQPNLKRKLTRRTSILDPIRGRNSHNRLVLAGHTRFINEERRISHHGFLAVFKRSLQWKTL